jgi:hypothetical protein
MPRLRQANFKSRTFVRRGRRMVRLAQRLALRRSRWHARLPSRREIARLHADEPALAFGRLYFREVAGSGDDFGHSFGPGGVVAFSRILSDREALVVANTGTPAGSLSPAPSSSTATCTLAAAR